VDSIACRDVRYHCHREPISAQVALISFFKGDPSVSRFHLSEVRVQKPAMNTSNLLRRIKAGKKSVGELVDEVYCENTAASGFEPPRSQSHWRGGRMS